MDEVEQGRDGGDAAIAIVGRAARVPGARTVDEFWANLRSGVESLTRVSEEDLRAAGVSAEASRDPAYVPVSGTLPDMELFDAAFFGFSPRDAAIMDPQHRHFLECAWEALEDAGHPPDQFAGAIGVFAGSGMNAYLPYNLLSNPDLVKTYGLFLLRHTGNDKDFLATRVSYQLNLRGPSVNVQTACSTSLVAIHMAAQSLLSGECDLALAGGVTIELPHRAGYRAEAGGILSPDGHCRPFDAASKGTVFGSGAGVVVLRRLREAIADGDTIHAVIVGSAINNDGNRKVGYLAPSVDGHARVVAEALAVAGLTGDDISYVEAHGTGTPVGDPVEVAALTQAFRGGTSRTRYCALGSVKSNIGHLDTAAGVASVLKVVESLKHRELVPTLHFTVPNPELRLDETPFSIHAEVRPWTTTSGAPRRAGVSSLGVGGTNAHVILEEAPPRRDSGPSRARQVIVLSARTANALDQTAQRLVSFLEGDGRDVPLADIAFTLQRGRQTFAHRRAMVGGCVSDVIDALGAPSERVRHGTVSVDRTAAFMFAGGGAQFAGMGHALYTTEPIFREEVDRCLSLIPRTLAEVLRDVLTMFGQGATSNHAIDRPATALPALFVVQYAHAKLLMSWGLRPSALIGHSMGEYTAACLSGVFRLEDALALVALRGQLFERLAPGAMLSVPIAPADLEPLLGPATTIAAVNAPELCVASGPVAAIDDLAARLQLRGIDTQRLHIAVAAHSPMVDPILAEFETGLRRLTLGSMSIPIVSNRSGEWLTDREARDPQYWVGHLRHTVHFAAGVATLAADPSRVLLEVGPGRTLATLARLTCPAHRDRIAGASMPHADDPTPADELTLDAVARMWTSGVSVDWQAFTAGERRRRVSLPTYPFQHQRHWIEPGRPLPVRVSDSDVEVEPLAGDLARWGYQPVWQPTPLRPTVSSPPAFVTIVADDGGVAEALTNELRRHGCQAVETMPSARGAAAYRETWHRLEAEGRRPTDIVYLANLREGDDADPHAPFHRLLAFAQSLDALGGGTRLTLVGRGMNELAGEGLTAPGQAMALGVGAVLSAEIEGLRCRVVDLPAGARALTPDPLGALQLAEEVVAGRDDEVVAYRGRDRFVRRFAPCALDAVDRSAIREGGTYLITGGTAGIGLEIARHLGTTYRANVVLLGRTALPPRDSWPSRVAPGGIHDRTRRALDAILEIEAAGGRALPIAADVSSPVALRSALDQVREAFGALNGVVHAAGVLRDGLLAFKTTTDADDVLAPKVRGTLALDEALGSTPLDFLILCSSVSAFAGLAGQVDYAAANAFLDAFARQRTSRTGQRTIAVAWSVWRDVGMVAERARRATGEPVDHPLFDRVVANGETDEFQTDLAVTERWLLDEHRLKDGRALIPGAGYVELARAALVSRPREGTPVLGNLFFLSAFGVADDERKALSLVLNRATGEFVIRSRAAGESSWVEHVQGTAARTPVESPASIDLTAVRGRCVRRDEQVTDVVNRAHLRLGPRWHCLERIEFGDAEALATLVLPEAFRSELETYALHPALLDVATAGVPQLIPGFDPEADFYVPVSYGRVVMHAGLTPRVQSHVRLQPGAGGESGFATFDITICDPDGRVLVSIDQFQMKRVAATALSAGGGPTAAAVSVSDARPVGAIPLGDASREGIGTADGLEVLERALAQRVPAHIVISPRGLESWLRAMREAQRPAPVQANTPPVPAPAANEYLEVEAALVSHDAVVEAAVMGVDDVDGQRKVLAFVVYDPDQPCTVTELRRHVRARVADVLVPAQLLEIDRLPRLATGEIDRSRLPNPFARSDEDAGPATPTGQVIAEIWQDLLGITRVGGHENFFDLGGHSLLSLHALARIQRRLGVSLQHADIVVSSLDQLAARCQELMAGQADAATRASGSAA